MSVSCLYCAFLPSLSVNQQQIQYIQFLYLYLKKNHQKELRKEI